MPRFEKRRDSPGDIFPPFRLFDPPRRLSFLSRAFPPTLRIRVASLRSIPLSVASDSTELLWFMIFFSVIAHTDPWLHDAFERTNPLRGTDFLPRRFMDLPRTCRTRISIFSARTACPSVVAWQCFRWRGRFLVCGLGIRDSIFWLTLCVLLYGIFLHRRDGGILCSGVFHGNYWRE